ncbi:MAG TPA: T9SS type A sorting domain-containing protein [Puia sp.]|nr:T9SS type A sorting domain-containing protein [Puia sp.]
MKQLYLPAILSLFFFVTNADAQTTTTITYKNSGLSQTQCNVFATPTSVGGVTHEICSGGVAFNGTNLELATGVDQSNNTAGTAYIIQFSFNAGTPYSISINAASNSKTLNIGAGIFASYPSFADQTATCLPDAGEQKIGTATVKNGITNLTTTNTSYTLINTFTPTSTLGYLVIGAADGSNASIGYIESITITAQTCNLPAPTGLTTTNGGTTLNWNAVSGAISYNISVNDNGTIHNLTSSTTSVSYCPVASGDNLSFTVQSVCSGGLAGGISGANSYSYTGLSTAPAGLSYNPTANILSWDAVPGATAYNLQITGPGGTQPYGGLGTSVSATTLELSPGDTYEASVNAYNNCSSSSWSSTYQFEAEGPCGTPSITSVSNPNGSPTKITVNWLTVSGAASYNLEFFLNGNENNTPTVVTGLTGSSYTWTAPTYGQYGIGIQAVCPWGSSSYSLYNGGAPVPSSVGNGHSIGYSTISIEGAVNATTDSMSIFPVPLSSSQLKVVYNTRQNGKAKITIVNGSGVPLVNANFGVAAGQNNFTLNVGQLVSGIYFVKLADGQNNFVKKLIIQK